MDGKDIISAILAQENKNASQFCIEIGLEGSKAQALYDVLRGKTKKVSARIANLIHSAKPMYNLDWLLTGEGEMLNTDIPAEHIKIERPNERIDSLSVINRLIEINSQKDAEIKELRQAYEHLAQCFEKLVNRESTTNVDKKAISL